MPDAAELAALDATAQAALVASKEVTATELVDAAIARAEQVNGELNLIVHPRYDDARADAAAGPTGPFAGVPFVEKDLDGRTAGRPYHGGTKFLRDVGYVPDTDTELNARLREAGLISIGRTNVPELGLVTSTEPVSHGASRNPWDPERSVGGSSGGSAGTVAAGIVPVAHAGDGGGSIRLPASYCGLVGLKPSRGRVTVGPEVGEAWAGLVARLAITRSVRDTAAILDAVAGPGVGDPYWAPPPERPYVDELGADPGRLRIGWVASPPDGSAQTDPEIIAATEATAELLISLGHEVEESYPAVLGEGDITNNFLVAYTAWVARELEELHEWTGVQPTEDGFEPHTWALAEAGKSVAAIDYLKALEGLHAATRKAVSWWAGGFDLLLTPTVPEVAPTLGQFGATPDNPLAPVFRASPTVAFTAPFNVTGQPAISLPLHENGAGLPIGMQLVAAPAREDVLIRIASQLEQAQPWADRRPQIWTGA